MVTLVPGFFLQKVNAILHQEPIASIFYTLYWTILFTISFPIIIIYLHVQCIINVFAWYLQRKRSNNFHPNNKPEYDLAIVITGCDTGFGKDLAIHCADIGYTVFAGCYQYEQSKELYKTIIKIIPFSLDVTNDNDVLESATLVQQWLDETNIPVQDIGRKRILHALINNAGIGSFGETSYTPLQDYQNMMDVNYFGIIRMVQGFIPIFTKQLLEKEYYNTTRIINVVSMAGLVSGAPGISGYHAAKHAAQAYTEGLRIELKPFHIAVTSVNPTFHTTAIVEEVDTRTGDSVMKKISNETVKAQFGKSYFDGMVLLCQKVMTETRWNSIIVVEQIIEKCIINNYPTKTLVVGMDGKYSSVLLRMIPSYIYEPILEATLYNLRPKPECIIQLNQKIKVNGSGEGSISFF